MSKKARLDNLLETRGLISGVSEAESLILAGRIWIDGIPAKSVAQLVNLDAVLEIRRPKGGRRFVSRAGEKLDFAIKTFGISLGGLVCADVGACTGGFTQVLLQHDARKVYAIDVSYGALAWELRQDQRVIALERTNARNLDALPEKANFISADVSFISLRLIIPQFRKWWVSGEDPSEGPLPGAVVLVKPQFEAPKSAVDPGGIVSNPQTQRQVLADFINWAADNKFNIRAVCRSPIKGTKGNTEYLVWIHPEAAEGVNADSLLEPIFPEVCP